MTPATVSTLASPGEALAFSLDSQFYAYSAAKRAVRRDDNRR